MDVSNIFLTLSTVYHRSHHLCRKPKRVISVLRAPSNTLLMGLPLKSLDKGVLCNSASSQNVLVKMKKYLPLKN